MEEQRISDEDLLLIFDIFKKALEYRPQIPKAVMAEEFSSLSLAEMLTETITPRIAVHYMGKDGRIPCLFFRFVGDESPLIEALFYPIEAIYSFLTEARTYVRLSSLPERTNDEMEKIAVERAIEMTLMMLDSFYSRADLMMDSFITEVIIQWHVHHRKNLYHYYAERGEPLPHQKDTSLQEQVKTYSNEVVKLWKYQGQTYGNWQKIRFAEEYEAISKHWKWLSKMSREDMDWREYATPRKFSDTPDDLLNRLENADRLDSNSVENKVSELALEHAARRVRLIKKRGVSEAVINQRKQGIRATGYTSTQLFVFLKEGRELVAQLNKTPEATAHKEILSSLEQNGDSA